MNKQYHLYIKPSCSFCKEALKLLDEHGLQYTVATVHKDEELLNEVKKKYDWKTVPIILEFSQVEGVRFVGGYSDLYKHLGGNLED